LVFFSGRNLACFLRWRGTWTEGNKLYIEKAYIGKRSLVVDLQLTIKLLASASVTKPLFIVGTDHKYQHRSCELTELQHEDFERYIGGIVLEKKIALLAEENNEQFVQENGLAQSTIQKLAKIHSVEHLFCELDRKSRAENGMEQESGIQISGLLNGHSKEEIARNIQESYRNREAYWLKCILEKDVWPVLFICGANHAIPFQELVSRNDALPLLLSGDWSN